MKQKSESEWANKFPKTFPKWIVKEGWTYEDGKWIMEAARDLGSKTTEQLHENYLYELQGVEKFKKK